MAGPRPARPPRPPAGGPADGLNGTWANRSGTTSPAQAASLPHKAALLEWKSRLFNCVSGIVAPPEAVRLPVQSLQCAPVVRGRARGIDRHHHFIPHLQGVPLDPLLA